MSAEQNKAIIERINEEIWNKGNLDLIPQFISPEYVYHSPMAGDMKGHEGYKQYVTFNRTLLSDYHGTLTSVIAEGDMVAIRLAYTGTNTGSIMGVPPTGKKINMEIAIFVRFENGKEVEEWAYLDTLTFFKQLGIPVPQELS